MNRLTRKEADRIKQENSLANWSKVIVKNPPHLMTFEEKKELYNQLTLEQKNDLIELYDYFNSRLWCTEPFKELFGVSWGQTDLDRILNV